MHGWLLHHCRGEPADSQEEALRSAEAVIAGGGIVAIKGLGGYQLVCDATSPSAALRLRKLLDAPDCEVQGFLAAGHVCAVMGWTEYEPIARYRAPIVVTGFEPLDLLEGILLAVRQLEAGQAAVENQYARAVRRSGNTEAQDAIRRVFRVTDRSWRGIGTIPTSGRTGRRARRARHSALPWSPPKARVRPSSAPGGPDDRSCPAPRVETERVLLGHGSGGQLSAALVREVIVPALAESAPSGPLEDSAVLEVGGVDLVMSTDSFVVSPLFFPGGDIGKLAVHGTVTTSPSWVANRSRCRSRS